MKRVEDFIKSNRTAFDDLKAPAGVWHRIERRMEPKVTHLWKWSAIAASGLLLIAVGYIFGMKSNPEQRIAGWEQFEEAERFYESRIQVKMEAIQSYDVGDEVLSDIQVLDEVYNQLRQQLMDDPNTNAEVLLAKMIRHQKQKLEVMDKILDRVKKYDSTKFTLSMKCNVILLLLLPCFAFADGNGERMEKKITKQFAITSNGRFTVDNKYGNVDIAIGVSNAIHVEVTIIAEAGNVKKAQEGLDRIHVTFAEGMNRVDASTTIESSSSWMNLFNSESVSMEINYRVLVPADIYLELKNSFGDIYLERTDRDIIVDIGYGDLQLGDINANLKLDMAYSDGSMSSIHQGDLNLSYSDLDMENGSVLDIDMKYTDLVMGSATRLTLTSTNGDINGMDVDEIHYTGKYDDLEFDRTKKVNAKSDFSEIHLQGLDQTGEFDMRYGLLIIENIGRSFSKLNINTSYTTVALSFIPGGSFTVDAEVSYCEIEYDNLKVSEDIQRTISQSFKASRGSGGGQVYARMTYGELILDK